MTLFLAVVRSETSRLVCIIFCLQFKGLLILSGVPVDEDNRIDHYKAFEAVATLICKQNIWPVRPPSLRTLEKLTKIIFGNLSKTCYLEFSTSSYFLVPSRLKLPEYESQVQVKPEPCQVLRDRTSK